MTFPAGEEQGDEKHDDDAGQEKRYSGIVWPDSLRKRVQAARSRFAHPVD